MKRILYNLILSSKASTMELPSGLMAPERTALLDGSTASVNSVARITSLLYMLQRTTELHPARSAYFF